MKTHAYPEIYLEEAMNNAGFMLDFAANVCKIAPATFYSMLITSKLSMELETGSPKYIVGMSGIELALTVIGQSSDMVIDEYEYNATERTPEFWGAWVTAYFQWYSGYSLAFLQNNGLDIQKVISLYPTLHEADLSKFIEIAYEIIEKHRLSSIKNLKNRRQEAHLTQSQLAACSGVKLRMIQAYEQGTQRIEKAEVSSVLSLARVLKCSVEDLTCS